MNHETHNANVTGHGDYERRDIGVAGVLYFLAGLAISGVLVYFIVNGLFWYFDKRFETEQTPISPLVKNAPSDTRRIPPQYNGDYEKYLKESFPAPQLEVNERTELNDIRLREENTLSTYDWVDQKAGTVRIPIDPWTFWPSAAFPCARRQRAQRAQPVSKRKRKASSEAV
jgi:hypothetical protein